MGTLPFLSVKLKGMELATGEKWREIRVTARLQRAVAWGINPLYATYQRINTIRTGTLLW